METIILTGGAGFIGSCVLRMLNDDGLDDVIVIDNIASTEKWRNLSNKNYREYVNKEVFQEKLKEDNYKHVSAVIHLGACSSTTENNFDYLWNNNVQYSKDLWNFCADKGIPFIYASSAATYGDGSNGFDDKIDIRNLRPMNGYGYSKQAFDLWTMKQMKKPPQYVGLKFFNVYGPNEYFKGRMASMAFHGYNQMISTGKIRLFKSDNPDYADGAQKRDFVYVKDVCHVIKFFFEHRDKSGTYNVGTGRAQTFEELVTAVFQAANREIDIEYIDMPESLKRKYQYYTKADITKLREAGYGDEFMNVERGVKDYISLHLDKDYGIY